MLKTTKTKISKRAFSLLELSVVILVIGILITGVMKGGSLVSASRLNAARSLTARSPVGEINGLTAWYETTSLQSFGTRKAGVSGASPTAATILVAQLTESRTLDKGRVEIWRDISPKCINNYSIANTTTSTPTQATDYINTCNALSQATLDNRPYYGLSGINNLPSVSFEGSQGLLLDSFRDGNIASSTKFVVFSVDTKPTSGTHFILDNNPTSTQQRIALSSTNISVNNGTDTSIASYNVKNTYILAVISAGGTSYYKINNNALSTSINPGSNTATGLTVGGITNTFFRGKISEIIVFNRMLQQGEITEIFNYLGKKYKVQVL